MFVDVQSTYTPPCRVNCLQILHMKEFTTAYFLAGFSAGGAYSLDSVGPASKSTIDGHARADRLSYCFIFVVVHRDAAFLDYMGGLFLCAVIYGDELLLHI